MATSGTRVVFFGTDDFSLATLKALVKDNWDVALVVTKPDKRSGRGMELKNSPVKEYALNNDLPVVQPERMDDVNDVISSIDGRVGVLSSYGKIIPQSTLDLFDAGIINVHPSLLPRYRGPTPIETAVLNGDQATGVSLMKLVARMDAGPLFAQEIYGLSDQPTAESVYKVLAERGGRLLVTHLQAIIDGRLVPEPQDEREATYTNLLSKKDSFVTPSDLTTREFDRHVRAYTLYPGTKIELFGKMVTVLKSHITENEARPVTVTCRDELRVTIDELIAPSGKKMTGADFLRGYGAK